MSGLVCSIIVFNVVLRKPSLSAHIRLHVFDVSRLFAYCAIDPILTNIGAKQLPVRSAVEMFIGCVVLFVAQKY